MDFPDSDLAVRELVMGAALATRVVTRTPIDLKTVLDDGGKVLRVQRIGGEDDPDAAEDYPVMTLQGFATFADDRPARQLVADVQALLSSSKGVYLPGTKAMLLYANTVSGPTEVPYTDSGGPVVQVFQGVTRVVFRGV